MGGLFSMTAIIALIAAAVGFGLGYLVGVRVTSKKFTEEIKQLLSAAFAMLGTEDGSN
jgi:uncharacterized protein YebE (UPF0316 family)